MPPAGVKKGTKSARQYSKIKKSAKSRGASTGRAKQVAARTVNKKKSSSSSSKSKSSSSRGRSTTAKGRSSSSRSTSSRSRSSGTSGRSRTSASGRSRSTASGRGRSTGSSSRSRTTGSSSRSRTATSRSRSSASRNGGAPTLEQLRNQAKRLNVEGRSKMNKSQLQRAVAGKKAARSRSR